MFEREGVGVGEVCDYEVMEFGRKVEEGWTGHSGSYGSGVWTAGGDLSSSLKDLSKDVFR